MLFYFQSRYPYYSQTFVSREIKYFSKKRGVKVISLHKPPLGIFYPFRSSLEVKVFFPLFFKVLFSSVSWKEILFGLYALLNGLFQAGKIRSSDTIRAHLPKYNGLAALAAAKVSGARFIPVFHSYALYTHNTFLKEICERADYVETISKYNAVRLSKLTNCPVRVIHCGVDTALLQKEEATRGRHLLYAGRLHPTKGISKIISILKDTDIKIRFIGGGRIKYYQKAAKRAGIDAEFTGPLPHSKLIDEMDRAALLLLPASIAKDGDRDGIPVVLMEAMARGLPVITTPISGIPELVIHRKTGFLFKNELKARQIISEILENGAPDEIIENAKEIIREEFNYDKAINSKERYL